MVTLLWLHSHMVALWLHPCCVSDCDRIVTVCRGVVAQLQCPTVAALSVWFLCGSLRVVLVADLTVSLVQL